jgi:hypothetical protein
VTEWPCLRVACAPICYEGGGAIALKWLVASARSKAKGVAATTEQSPLGRTSPGEIYRGEGESAELPSPVALIALDSFVHRLLVRKRDGKSGTGAYISFASRSAPTLSHGPFPVETAHGRAVSRRPTQSERRPSSIEPSRLTDDRVAPPMRAPVRYSPHLLLLACGVAGVAAGVGGTYLLSTHLPLGTHLQEMRTPGFAAPLVRADAPSDSMRPSVDEFSRDPTEEGQTAKETGSHELSAPVPVILGKVEWPTSRRETAPTASIETPSPDAGAGSAPTSADPIVDAPSHSMRPSVDELSREPNDESQAAKETDSQELSAPVPVVLGKVEGPTNPSETAPTASIEMPSPAAGAGSTPTSADPIVVQPSDQGASSEAAGSRDDANAPPIVTTPSQVSAVTPEEMRVIASVAMTRGDDAIGHGDVISARRYYELAATSGLTQAATAVGRTYDPIFLRDKGVRGRLADVEAAKGWYQKALDGGDAEARMRLDILLHAPTVVGASGLPARHEQSVAVEPSPECLPYTSDVSLFGGRGHVRGIVCRDPDGRWRIVSEPRRR